MLHMLCILSHDLSTQCNILELYNPYCEVLSLSLSYSLLNKNAKIEKIRREQSTVVMSFTHCEAYIMLIGFMTKKKF